MLNRRLFLKRTGLTTVGIGLYSSVLEKLFAATIKEYSGEIPKRVLGKTNEKVSIIGLGGWHIGNVKDENVAIGMINSAYEAGVNFFDTAFSYNDGISETRYGKAMKTYGLRDKVFLMTKSTQREGIDARKELELSLQRLQTDHVDLWQIHSIKTQDDLDKAFSPGGIYETALKAKKEGKIRYIGITGHYDPYINYEAVKNYHQLLDTIQMPINLVDPNSRSFINIALPEALKHNLGIIAMKTIANGGITENNIATASDSLTYVWNLPVSLIVSGCDSQEHLSQNINTAKSYRKLDVNEKNALTQKASNVTFNDVEYYKKK